MASNSVQTRIQYYSFHLYFQSLFYRISLFNRKLNKVLNRKRFKRAIYAKLN